MRHYFLENAHDQKSRSYEVQKIKVPKNLSPQRPPPSRNQKLLQLMLAVTIQRVQRVKLNPVAEIRIVNPAVALVNATGVKTLVNVIGVRAQVNAVDVQCEHSSLYLIELFQLMFS